MNFDPKKIQHLHEISYYGVDFTDRQRFKRTMTNTIRKIDELDPIAKNFFVGQLLEKESAAKYNLAMHPGILKNFEKQFNEKLSGCSPEYTKPIKIEIFKTKNK